MELSNHSASGMRGRRLWPTRSRAAVSFFLGERSAAERLARRIFYGSLELADYAGLAGAPDAACVEVGVSRGRLHLELRGPDASYCGYYYLRRQREETVLVNDGFHIRRHDLRRRGLGLQIFRRQVGNAARLGVHHIEVLAGRRRDESGYYAWPRFGFDGFLPQRLRRGLPVVLRDSKTILDLMDSEAGRAWWRDHGETIRLTFALHPGSRSLATLARYLREAGISCRGPKRNLERSGAVAYRNAR